MSVNLDGKFFFKIPISVKKLSDRILKGDKESKMEDVEEQDLEANSGTLKSRTVKEEFSEEVKTELSQPAAKPIKHNPESGSNQKNKVAFGQNNFGGTALDRVLNRLNKQ
jgi:hypothetical protein